MDDMPLIWIIALRTAVLLAAFVPVAELAPTWLPAETIVTVLLIGCKISAKLRPKPVYDWPAWIGKFRRALRDRLRHTTRVHAYR